MKDEPIKPQIDLIKKDPSLNEILNIAQGLLTKIPEMKSNETAAESEMTSTAKQLNKNSLDSLLTTAKSIVNPTTLSLLSKTINQPETKRKDSPECASLKQAIQELTAELNQVKEDLAQTKNSKAEMDQQLKEIETEIQLLKRRRRR
jgi:archaellum component FlaC